MTVIQFNKFPGKEKSLSNFFAEQEIKDFEDMLEKLEEQCEISYLFQRIDIKKFHDDVMNYVRKRYFDKNGRLLSNEMKNINRMYGERFDIDEFYEKFIKPDNKD